MAEANFIPSTRYAELCIGAGPEPKKLLAPDGKGGWKNLVTLDINELVNPDVVHDLNDLPLPFQDQEFDEVHAYEVLERFGTQGDYMAWFAFWDEIYRILKPGGMVFGSVPVWNSQWAFGDPGHTRCIPPVMFMYLDRQAYGAPVMTDYLGCFECDFVVEGGFDKEDRHYFALRKRQ